MGGEGSGRKPSEETIVARMTEQRTPIANDVWLPNYSGVQAAALKTATAIGTGGGSGHVIKDEAGADLTARRNLNFTGAGVVATDNAGTDSTDVTIAGGAGAETDPVFMALSGSIANYALSGGATVTLGVTQANVLSLSGSAWTHILSGTNAHGGIILSGSTPLFALSGGATISLGTHMLSGSNAHGGIITSGSTALFALSGGASVSLGTHMLSGSNAHVGGIITSGSTALFALSGGATVSLGVHAADSTDPHGTTLTQTNLYFTSGSRTGDISLSGSPYVPNVLFGYTSGSYTASDYPLGTILFIYAP